MPCREFADPTGQRWTVWSVTPMRAERRLTGERRDNERPAGRALLGRGRERRDADRPAPARTLRLGVLPAMLKGWLCFESEHEKRRLAPIPPGWERMSDRGLAALCERATIVSRGARQRFGATAQRPRARCMAPRRLALAPRGERA